jgi:hypothetical protein
MVAALNAAVAEGVPGKKGKSADKIKCNRCGLWDILRAHARQFFVISMRNLDMLVKVHALAT